MNRTRRILVVDDDPAVTERLEVELHARYEVASVHDPRQALALARALAPDAVLCGVDLPRMPGVEVCHALAEDPQTCDVAFVYLVDGAAPAAVDGRAAVDRNAPAREIAACIEQALRRRGH
jgi:CheY-like chemotaxis protein